MVDIDMELQVSSIIFALCVSGVTAVLFGRHPRHPSVEEQSKSYQYNTSYYEVQVCWKSRKYVAGTRKKGTMYYKMKHLSHVQIYTLYRPKFMKTCVKM